MHKDGFQLVQGHSEGSLWNQNMIVARFILLHVLSC